MVEMLMATGTALDRAGNPLVQPTTSFPTALLPWHSNILAAGEAWAKDVAMHAYNNVLRRRKIKGKYNKTYPGTRPMKALRCR